MDKTNNYFKILKEINYSEFLKSKDKKENLISALKNRDKWSLSKFSDTSDMSQQVNVYIKNENYLDGLIKLDKLKDLSRFSVKYLHNKYLDYLVENDDSCYDNEIITYIANLGIPKYLDKILQKDKYNNNFEISAVLRNGRKKDIEKYIDDDQYADDIIRTGIYKYLDEFITNKSDFICRELCKIGRKKDIDFLKDKELDSSKAELLVQHIYDLKYLKEIEPSKKSKISCIAEYSIIKNDLDRKNISFVYYFQIDKSKILKIRYSDFLREVDFSIFSKNKNKLNKINFIGFDDGNDFVIDFYKKWGLRFEPKLNDNEYVDLLNDIKQLKTKYNYFYDNDFCDFDYSEEDLKYLLKKELKTNNI